MVRMNALTKTAPSRLGLLAVLLLWAGVAFAAGTVHELELKGALGVATAEYIIGGIENAEDAGANAVIIRMDTPGGLVGPMRDIVSKILTSSVPVITYVSPAGARADSAGTYILLASHIAAMAPTTHLGAATPVSMMPGNDFSPGDSGPGEDSPDETTPTEGDDEEAAEPAAERTPAPQARDLPGTAMERKVLNDAIAYIRGLAELHGRNADWAEAAVRSAETLTSADALTENVIDLIAADRAELLQAVDGREVKLNNKAFVIDTADVTVEEIKPNLRQRLLNTIASPEIAILLLMVGLYGLLLEGYSPGAIVPGVTGVISLLLAAYALQVLPVNYAGLALLVVGMALIIAEAFAPSFGALGLGGVAAIIFGSLMMFDSGIPGFGISLTFVISVAIVAGGLLLWLVTYLMKLQRRGAVSGRASIIGAVAVATESFVDNGHVWLEGESWSATSHVPIEKDQHVFVRAMNGLVLTIEPLPVTEAEEKIVPN